MISDINNVVIYFPTETASGMHWPYRLKYQKMYFRANAYNYLLETCGSYGYIRTNKNYLDRKTKLQRFKISTNLISFLNIVVIFVFSFQ